MPSLVETVELGRRLKAAGRLNDEDMANLAGAEAQLGAAVDKGRSSLTRDDFTFDDYKRLKRAETALGRRQPEGPGFVEAAGRIAAQPREAAGEAAQLGAKAGVNLARAGGAAFKGAAQAAAHPVATARAAGKAIAETAQDISTPEGALAAVRGVADITGLGAEAAKLGLRAQALRTGAQVSEQDIRDYAEFEDEKQRAQHGKALATGQLIGGAVLGGGRTLTGAAARAAGASAGVTASEGGTPEEIVAAGLTGAALPAAVTGVGRGVAIAARPLTSRLPGAEGPAARAALARIVKNPAAVEAERLRISGATPGAPASLVEALPDEQAAKLGHVAAVGAPETAATLQAATQRVVREAGEGVAQAAEAGTVPRAAEAVREEASDKLTRLLRKEDKLGRPGTSLAARPVTLPQALTDSFSENGIIGSLPVAIRKKFSTVGASKLPLDDVDKIRRIFDKVARSSPEKGQAFRDAADAVEEAASGQVKEYGRGLQDYARAQRRADGIEEGRAAFGSPTGEAAARADRLRTEAVKTADKEARTRAKAKFAGFAEGMRAAAAEQARSGAGTPALAKALAGNRNLRSALNRAFGAPEGARLAGVGEMQAKRIGAAGIAATAATRRAQTALNNANVVERVIEGAIISGGRASGAFQASFVEKLITGFAVPPNVAKRMARMAVDPKAAPKLVRDLQKLGVRKEQIADAYRRAGVEAGILSAEGESAQ